MPTHTEIKASAVSRDHTEIAYWTSGADRPSFWSTGHPPTTLDGDLYSPTWSGRSRFMRSTGEVEVAAETLRSTAWNVSIRMLRPWWMPLRQRPGSTWTCTGIRTAASWHSAPQP
jgi:hypothetical protein